MNAPLHNTVVTFPAGDLTAVATVLHVEDAGERIALVTDRTPFHPIDHGWPDQGPDLGTVDIGGQSAPVLDVVVGATDGSALMIGEQVPVRRGEPGWSFVVVHLLAADGPRPAVGEQVNLQVDAAHRDALSVGHTACHVAALALNEALSPLWRKPVQVDGLDHADFDKLALATSRILPGGAIDTYRLGKSLRKKGFDAESLASELVNVHTRANGTLAGWVAGGAPIRIETAGPALTDLRTWVCELPEGTQRIACGGTHLSNLLELEKIEIRLDLSNPAELVMTTTATRR